MPAGYAQLSCPSQTLLHRHGCLPLHLLRIYIPLPHRGHNKKAFFPRAAIPHPLTPLTRPRPASLLAQTRAEYRRILERQGLIQPEDDIDISHIIAEENGGANHPDNLVCMGRSLNRRLQHRGDHLMVYQVRLGWARWLY